MVVGEEDIVKRNDGGKGEESGGGSENIINTLIKSSYKSLLTAISSSFFSQSSYNKTSLSEESYDNPDSFFIDAALTTINAIFCTAYWLIVLMICFGMMILSKSISRDKMKNVVKMFFIMYIIFCSDDILDAFEKKIWVFNLNEIKLILFYIYLIWYLRNNAYKVKRKLELIKSYAHEILPNFIGAIELKIKYMNDLICSLYLYLVAFSVILILDKTFLSEYDTPTFERFNYHLVDMLFITKIMYIFRPRKMPENFDSDLDQDLDVEKVMSVFRYSLREERENSYFVCGKLYKKRLFTEREKPILVIGPMFRGEIKAGNERIIRNRELNMLFESLCVGKIEDN